MLFLETIEKHNDNHDRLGKFCSAEENITGKKVYKDPAQKSKSVDWEDIFYGEQTLDTVVDIVEEYLPGAIDAAKLRKRRYDSEKEKTNNFTDIDKATVGDRTLSDVYAIKGYDALPEVLDHDDFEILLTKRGQKEFYRGFSPSSAGKTGKEKADDFISGDKHYAGIGIYGNGTYATNKNKNRSAVSEARKYSKNSEDAIIRFTLKRGSKILRDDGDYEDFNYEFEKAIESRTVKDSAKNSGESDMLDILQQVSIMTGDCGAYASLRGYDAVDTKHNGYTIILNRGAVIIDEKRYS